MIRVGRRCCTILALALVPSLIALPGHAATPDPTPSATSAPTSATPSPPDVDESYPTSPTEPAPTGTPSAEPTATPPEPSASTKPVEPPLRRSEASTTASRSTASDVGPSSAKNTSKRLVTIQINSGRDSRVLTRENFWLRGRVLTTSGKRQAGAKVKIYRDTKKGRTRVATVRTSKKGRYSWAPDKPKGGKYRAVVSTVRYSPKITVKRTTGRRTLASRETSLAFLLGTPRGGVRSSGRLKWREYGKAMLVQKGSRTWVVRGRPLAKFRAQGGPTGKFGPPTRDDRCGLPERACLQQFRTGAVYVNKKAKKRVTWAVAPKRGAADLVAVARSQVGYREPSPRKSKYNKWIGRTGSYDPWCGYFVSWLAHAAGKPGAVPKAKSFGGLLTAERKRDRIVKKPRVGRLAYIGYFSKGTASHVGIVTKVEGDHVWTIEGNVSSGGGMNHPRGVHLIKRHSSNVVFYANPRY